MEVGPVLPKVTLRELSWQETSVAVSGPAEETVAQHHIFYYHHYTVFQIHSVIIRSSCCL